MRTKYRQADAGLPRDLAAPLSEQAYRLLRKDILSATILPGTKLRIEELQHRYAFSSSPLREALSRLVSEHVVVADERRGFRAAPISAEDLRDLTQYRVVIETQAFERAMRHGDDGWEAEILAALHRLQSIEVALPLGSRSSDELWIQRHKAFHIALIAGCGLRRMILQCDALFDQSQRYRALWAQKRPRPRNAAGEHRLLAELALKRDCKRGVKLLREHIETTANAVAAFLT